MVPYTISQFNNNLINCIFSYLIKLDVYKRLLNEEPLFKVNYSLNIVLYPLQTCAPVPAILVQMVVHALMMPKDITVHVQWDLKVYVAERVSVKDTF